MLEVGVVQIKIVTLAKYVFAERREQVGSWSRSDKVPPPPPPPPPRSAGSVASGYSWVGTVQSKNEGKLVYQGVL